MRHLFVELPYYTAKFLNLWMKADNDAILDAVYADWEGTASYTPVVKAFYKSIKTQYPETIFHGTDVGHQYFSTGKRFLEYLEQNNLQDSEQYILTQEAIAQGEYFYDKSDDVYRENKMTENFIREFDALNPQGEEKITKIMGIFGAAHTGLNAKDFAKKTPNMATQLQKYYGNIIFSMNASQGRSWW